MFHVEALLPEQKRGNRKGFRTEVLPVLQKRELGVLGIKSPGGTPAKVLRNSKYTTKKLLPFSLSRLIGPN